MNALLFSNLFPTSGEPQRGVFTYQLAAELRKLCPLRVAVPLPWFPSGPLAGRLFPDYSRRFGRLEPLAGMAELRISYPRYALIPRISESVHADLMWLGTYSHVQRLHAAERIDVINAHWLYPDGVVAARIGRRLRIPVVLTALGCDANEFLLRSGLRRRILGALASAHAVTTVSSELAGVLRDAGVPSSKLTVIPNGVDSGRFAPRRASHARAELGLPREQPLIVCVSRLSAEKGVRFLIEAVAELRKRAPEVLVRIAGDGEERASLEALAARLALSDRVGFVGAVSHSEVGNWLNAASVVCIPSVREGHPNVAMEALACGRPLVASSVGALPELIDEHSGVLVEPQDPRALAQALERALGIPWNAERIAASVRHRGWGDSARRYFEVMQSAVTDSAGCAQRRELAA